MHCASVCQLQCPGAGTSGGIMTVGKFSARCSQLSAVTGADIPLRYLFISVVPLASLASSCPGSGTK